MASALKVSSMASGNSNVYIRKLSARTSAAVLRHYSAASSSYYSNPRFTSASALGFSNSSCMQIPAASLPPITSLKRGISTLGHVPKLNRPKALALRGIRFQFPDRLRRYTGRRGYSSNSSSSGQQQKKQQNRAKKAFLRFWALPALTTVVIWSVIRRNQDTSPQTNKEEEVGQPAQPWKVAAYSTLPLKAISRLWGRFNDIDLPVWMRDPGYRLYSYIFGVNLDEVANDDLKSYPNLGEFFYRELKPGVRPIDQNAPVVSPADGEVLHLGIIQGGQVEQVKGITYSLEALLGSSSTVKHAAPSHSIDFDESSRSSKSEEVLERDKKFAELNGISYTLDDLIGSDTPSASSNTKTIEEGDATMSSASSFVSKQVAKSIKSSPFSDVPISGKGDKELFFCVVYLSPGDYHRFHSPVNWVTELRRHFVGELYSVAPYFQSRLSNLFVLNERVALLGRWKHGFFSMTPVGATNVGSIRIHFDKGLATNTVYENEIPVSDTASINSTDSGGSVESSKKRKNRVQKSTCYEATYTKASSLLNGYPLLKGQQMGGFNLGSTVVLVFEAPKSFKFVVHKGEKVKVGQALGHL